jgi:hypothetical protein
VLAFQIEIDGHSWQLAGIEDWETLLLQLSAIRPRGDPEIEIHVHATFGADERGVNNVRWAKSPKLALGSQVTIRVVEADRADEPIRSSGMMPTCRRALSRRRKRKEWSVRNGKD